ncbi:MAG: hypothetical protein JSR65_14475 [Proteobacteria bacterium]|nr:hypothetical protein [Pseudomonadota bacterium]
MTNTIPLNEKLRKELDALENRLSKTEEKYGDKPHWYKQSYGDRRLKKIQRKIDHAKDALKSEELRQDLEARLAKTYPEVTKARQTRL